MDFDINTLRGLSTLMVMAAFIGICVWAWSDKRKSAFDEAANLPFADEPADTGQPAAKAPTQESLQENRS